MASPTEHCGKTQNNQTPCQSPTKSFERNVNINNSPNQRLCNVHLKNYPTGDDKLNQDKQKKEQGSTRDCRGKVFFKQKGRMQIELWALHFDQPAVDSAEDMRFPEMHEQRESRLITKYQTRKSGSRNNQNWMKLQKPDFSSFSSSDNQDVAPCGCPFSTLLGPQVNIFSSYLNYLEMRQFHVVAKREQKKWASWGLGTGRPAIR